MGLSLRTTSFPFHYLIGGPLSDYDDLHARKELIMTPLIPDQESGNSIRHEEWLMDEAIRGSFPASDPASSSEPGSIVNRRYAEAAARRARSSVPAVAALFAIGVALALPAGDAVAQDKAAYDQRAIARFEQQFAALDKNHKDEVSRSEAQGNIDFTVAFDDMDINRDGVVTKAELDRFLALRYGASRNE